MALELLGLKNQGYQALFLQGGASMEFLRVPYNLMKINGKASYLDTGTWASGAIKQAKIFGNTEIIASSKDENYSYIPKITPFLLIRIIFTVPVTILFTELKCMSFLNLMFLWFAI